MATSISEIFGKNALTERFKSCKEQDFPYAGQIDYENRIVTVWERLAKDVYPHMTAAATVKDGGYLTDHGEDHIKRVVERAANLLSDSAKRLSCYEAYVLIMAAMFHDVGNLYGREGHELQAQAVMEQIVGLLGDKHEYRTIYRISQAHGGKVAGDKDKISQLETELFVLGFPVHPRLLAALLRFADELADDRTRAATFIQEAGLLPKSSEIYHKYAHALHSVVVKVPGDTIDLFFEMPVDDAIRKFGKGSIEVYLLDEIYERTLKMHSERIYCMRFLKPIVSIDKINVSISIWSEDFNSELLKVDYRLEESGYPSFVNEDIFKLCPQLEYTGQKAHSFLEGKGGGDSAGAS